MSFGDSNEFLASFEDDERVLRADGGEPFARRGAEHLTPRGVASSGDEYSDFDDGESSDDGSEAEREDLVVSSHAEKSFGGASSFESDSDDEIDASYRRRPATSVQDPPPSLDTAERERTEEVWAVLAKRVRRYVDAGRRSARRPRAAGGGVPSVVSKTLIAALRARNAASGAPAHTRSVRSDVSATLARRIAERTAAASAASAAAAALDSALSAQPLVCVAAAADAARRVRVPRAVVERLSARNVVHHGHDPFTHLHGLRGELQAHERLPRDVVLRQGLRELTARLDRQATENTDRNARESGTARAVRKLSGAPAPKPRRTVIDEMRARKTRLEPWELELLAIDARADQLYARIAARPEELAEEAAALALAEMGSAAAPAPILLTATSAALLQKVAKTFAGDDAFPLLPKRRPVDSLDSTTLAAPFALQGSALGDARV